LAVPQWPATAAGQQQFLTDLRNMLLKLPHGAGEGIVYWYPEAVQVPGYNIYNGGATALVDGTAAHNALPAVNSFLVICPGDFNADGHLTAADISAMLSALADLNTYKSIHNFTDADLLNIGDLDGDHAITNRDIQSVLDALAISGSGGFASVPEPTTQCLFLLAAITVIVGRRLRRQIG
jgi:hypothetical protein